MPNNSDTAMISNDKVAETPRTLCNRGWQFFHKEAAREFAFDCLCDDHVRSVNLTADLRVYVSWIDDCRVSTVGPVQARMLRRINPYLRVLLVSDSFDKEI